MINQPSLFKAMLLFSGIAIASASLTATPLPQQEVNQETFSGATSDMTQKEVGMDFRLAAKKTIPAVVSIKVQSKSRSVSEDSQLEDFSDLFGSQLREFFNIPNRESRQQPSLGQASGVIVSPEGYILTNSHVVSDMDQIRIQLTDGREFNATLLGEDKSMDLALIKIDAQNLPFARLGDSDTLEVGQWVAAIGNPFGLQATLTAGIVSAKGRNNLDIVRYEDFIQTDASINRGNSGGPLISLNGEVVGINTAIATNTASSYMGIGFAIPSNMARYVMNEILANGKVSHGFLGAGLQSIDYNLAQSFDLKKIEGALVASIVKGSSADKASLKVEDIILEYNHRPVENAAALRNAIYMMRPGAKVTFTILRQGQLMDVPVEIGEFSEEKEIASEPLPKNKLGIEVDNLNPEIAQTLGYTNEKGVIVTRVQPGSIAALAGLKKGALILSVNRKQIGNKEEFNAALRETSKGRPVLFQIKQGDQSVFLSLQTQ